jgi:glucose-6-phosphate isomerase
MAYLARGIDDAITKLRPLVAEKSGSGTSFGWGPRFLHSTGQYHKGGVPNGAFIQVTGESENDVEIPGKDFSFHTLLMAQALGDGEALQERKFPLIRFHLKNRTAGIEELLQAFRNLN